MSERKSGEDKFKTLKLWCNWQKEYPSNDGQELLAKDVNDLFSLLGNKEAEIKELQEKLSVAREAISKAHIELCYIIKQHDCFASVLTARDKCKEALERMVEKCCRTEMLEINARKEIKELKHALQVTEFQNEVEVRKLQEKLSVANFATEEYQAALAVISLGARKPKEIATHVTHKVKEALEKITHNKT